MPSTTQMPSKWVTRFAHLVPSDAPVLDLACGSGRHVQLFLSLGHKVIGVDIDITAIRDMPGDLAGNLECIEADLEHEPWPLVGRSFAAVIVTNYLWRPLLPKIISSVAPGGALIYETFGMGNGAYGRPANPDYLLAPGELLALTAPNFQVVAYEHGVRTNSAKGGAAVVSRIAAVRDISSDPSPLLMDGS